MGWGAERNGRDPESDQGRDDDGNSGVDVPFGPAVVEADDRIDCGVEELGKRRGTISDFFCD
jgi:hypothetical protein